MNTPTLPPVGLTVAQILEQGRKKISDHNEIWLMDRVDAYLKNLLRQFTPPVKKKTLSRKITLEILSIVCAETGTAETSVLQKGRLEKIMIARWLTQFYATRFGFSRSELGRIFGQHHTSVSNAISRLEEILNCPDSSYNHVRDLVRKLTPQIDKLKAEFDKEKS